MTNSDKPMLPPTPYPGIVASATKTALCALLSPMERVGMNPAEWFSVLATACPRSTKEEGN